MSEKQPKKLDINSKDIMGENLEKLKKMFPPVVKDGTVDVEALRNIIGDISEPHQEYYNFTWAGKSEAFKVIKEKTTATLKPMKSDDESVDFENTENIFIEGDNLEVLKILQKTYHNSIKMIYIDPPYNKDKDFVYPDKWSEGLSSYLKYSKLVDEEGNITSSSAEDKNVKAGRKHSRWLTMMYPRLFLAKNLLAENGMIFISIDNDEVKNLQAICDEIFGEENFIEQIIWKKRYGGGAKEKYLVTLQEYVLVYAKNKSELNEIFIPLTEDSIKRYYKQKDEKFEVRGPYRTHPLEAGKAMDERKNLIYPITAPDGKEVYPVRQWLWGEERALEALKNNELEFIKGKNGWSIHTKQYLKDENGKIREGKAFSIIDDVYTQHGTNEMIEIFGNAKVFSYPKPTLFLEQLLNIGNSKDNIILDFFAGSGSMANAIVNLNQKDNGQRKSISIQLPEHLDKKEQKDAIQFLNSIQKPTNIAEITKERIRRAGQKIKEENPDSNVDIGFKVFKLSESNFKQWDDTLSSKEQLQQAFDFYKDNVKEGANQLDMLYEVILAKGLSLNAKVTQKEVGGKNMFLVNSDGVELLACFEDEISEGALDAVIELRPIYFICLDSSFKSGSALKTNSVLRFRDADILFETV